MEPNQCNWRGGGVRKTNKKNVQQLHILKKSLFKMSGSFLLESFDCSTKSSFIFDIWKEMLGLKGSCFN